jgi:hypothetical protein
MSQVTIQMNTPTRQQAIDTIFKEQEKGWKELAFIRFGLHISVMHRPYPFADDKSEFYIYTHCRDKHGRPVFVGQGGFTFVTDKINDDNDFKNMALGAEHYIRKEIADKELRQTDFIGGESPYWSKLNVPIYYI